MLSAQIDSDSTLLQTPEKVRNFEKGIGAEDLSLSDPARSLYRKVGDVGKELVLDILAYLIQRGASEGQVGAAGQELMLDNLAYLIQRGASEGQVGAAGQELMLDNLAYLIQRGVSAGQVGAAGKIGAGYLI